MSSDVKTPNDLGDSPDHSIAVPTPKIPLTILTGQLGSGKSTVLRHLLSQNTLKVAVIMNEFAQTADIEGQALTVANEGVEVQEWLEMDNGCVCCSAQDGFVRAIELLIEKRRNFDCIILETTGVADPTLIAPLFWQDEGLDSSLYLDAVVAVVDSFNISKQLSEDTNGSSQAARQIACSDSIVISKLDLHDNKDAVIAQVQSLNTHAPINFASHGSIPIDSIIGLKAYSADAPPPDRILSTGVSSHAGITSVAIPIPQLAFIEPFDAALRNLLWDTPSEEEGAVSPRQILRCKGLVSVAGEEKATWFVIQGVREIYEITQVSGGKYEGEPRLVLIGRNLGHDLVESFLASLKAEA